MAVSLLTLDSIHGSRSASIIRDGILGFISTLASRNFVTRLVMSDGEGAIGKITGDLNLLGVEVDISGAGGHVARIERKIQTVKERVRAHISPTSIYTNHSRRGYASVILCVQVELPNIRNRKQC